MGAIGAAIIATPGEELPLKVVFRRDSSVVLEQAAGTASEAESLLRTGLSRLRETERVEAAVA